MSASGLPITSGSGLPPRPSAGGRASATGESEADPAAGSGLAAALRGVFGSKRHTLPPITMTENPAADPEQGAITPTPLVKQISKRMSDAGGLTPGNRSARHSDSGVMPRHRSSGFGGANKIAPSTAASEPCSGDVSLPVPPNMMFEAAAEAGPSVQPAVEEQSLQYYIQGVLERQRTSRRSSGTGSQ